MVETVVVDKRQKTHLSRHCYLSVVLHTGWTILPVRVVEDNRDRGLRDASLSTFIDEILLVLRTHLEAEKIR